MPKLHEFVGSVQSRSDLAFFIGVLIHDFREHPDQWENRDLSSYLEALSGFVEDMDKLYRNRGERLADQPSWQMVADMLFGATVYE